MNHIISSPGKVGGPCDRPCGHSTCHEQFQIAGTSCAKCKRPIGFDVELNRDDNGKLQHVVCPGDEPAVGATRMNGTVEKLCGCGCGEAAGVYARTSGGRKKGEPRRFISGHQGNYGLRVRWGNKTVEERFWEKVDKHGPFPKNRKLGRCWIWTGSLDARGYGRFTINHRTEYQKNLAHQFAYFLDRGRALRFSTQPWVLHKCDNPPCVRGSHLFAGTPKDNTDDRIAKGRGAGKRPKDWVLIAERVAQENGGLLPVSKRLIHEMNLGGLYQALMLHPGLFAHIKREKLLLRPEEWVPIAEERARNGGVLENYKWLEENGLNGLAQAINRRPDLFAHIKQKKLQLRAKEWVPIAERVARENGGLLPHCRRLTDEMNLGGLYQAFKKHPDLFKHLQMEKRNGDAVGRES